MSKSFNIALEGKPNLTRAFKDDPKLAKEVVGTFVALMEESFANEGGVPWAELPQLLHRDLTFADLVKGVLHGALDVKEINPDAFDALKAEVHPLSMLSPRKNYLDGGMKYANWRAHFRLPDNAPINDATIAAIFRTMLRHTAYVKIDELRKHLEYNQITTYRGLGDEQVKKLPFYPALRYQREKFGDLHVGKFFDDVGFLDCGEFIGPAHDDCPACRRHDVVSGPDPYIVCLACNAGFKIQFVEDTP